MRLGIFIIIVIYLFGCSSSKETTELSPEGRFEVAKDKFDRGKYLDAIEDFKIILLQYPASSVADDAQFYLAESYYNRKEYLLASHEYSNLVVNYPSSEFVPRARFKLAMCYYKLSPKSSLDQTYTLKAIDAFQAFIEYYPSHELVPDAEHRIHELINKLAKKDYDTGVLYMKMELYRAAIIYFDLVIERYPDSDYADKAYVSKIECLIKRKRFKEAIRIADEFMRKFPLSKLIERVEKLRREAEESVGRELQTGR